MSSGRMAQGTGWEAIAVDAAVGLLCGRATEWVTPPLVVLARPLLSQNESINQRFSHSERSERGKCFHEYLL
jgi:hypothetical protein